MMQQSPGMLFGQPQPSNNPFVSDRTSDSFDALGPVAGRGGLNIAFFWSRVRIDDPGNPSVNGTYKNVLCIAKNPKGDRLTTSVSMISEDRAKRQFPTEYAHFKHGESIPMDGTPLDELPGVTMSQIGICMVHGIRSIEDLLGMAEEHVGAIGMDALALYKLAKNWKARKDDGADVISRSTEQAAMQAEMDTLRRENTENARLIAEMKAKLDVLQNFQHAPAAQQGNGQVQLVDSQEPDGPIEDDFLGGGDVAADSSDLTAEPVQTADDPLGLKGGKK